MQFSASQLTINSHHRLFLIPPSPPQSSSNSFTSNRTRRRPFGPAMSLNHNQSSPDPLSSVAKLLWGPSLPPGLLISTARSAWHSAWRLMMAQLAPSNPSGAYSRPASRFRWPPNKDGAPPASLHLYVGLPCPWAHRTLLVRALKGLDHAVPVSVAAPGSDGAWEFRGGDGANGRRTLKEVYGLRRGGHAGRSTVPMLWDCERNDVVCNESYDIIELFNSGMNGAARNPELDLSPPPLKPEIERWNRLIYPNVNNGVYRCGFAQSQEAYDKAARELFDTLDALDNHLSNSRYLCGDKLTLADVCLFTTLIRFDLVYHGLFKCSKKKLVEYPSLHGYMRDIYQIPKVAETCDFPAIMDGYYKILFPLNPGSIRPVMPSGCEHEVLCKPHNRDSLSSLTNKSAEILVS